MDSRSGSHLCTAFVYNFRHMWLALFLKYWISRIVVRHSYTGYEPQLLLDGPGKTIKMVPRSHCCLPYYLVHSVETQGFHISPNPTCASKILPLSCLWGEHHPPQQHQAPPGVGLHGPESGWFWCTHHCHVSERLHQAPALSFLLRRLHIENNHSSNCFTTFGQLWFSICDHRRHVSDSRKLWRHSC